MLGPELLVGHRLFPPAAGLRLAAVAAVLALAVPGCCFRYRLGEQGLYVPTIRTVYVPMFQSDSYRRNLGERLTEAVVKEIQTRTPYQVVSTPNADSVLTGIITNETKRVLVESPLDEPRQLEVNFQIKVTWTDRQGDEIAPEQAIPISDSALSIGRAASVQIELGQTVSTGQQETINRLARQIVSMMEAPW